MSNTSEFTTMARIEVVIDAEHIPIIRDLLFAAGAKGYTALHGVTGYGHSGSHEGRPIFNDRNTLAMLICIAPLDRIDPIVAGVRKILEDHHGVVMVSDTKVSRADYF